MALTVEQKLEILTAQYEELKGQVFSNVVPDVSALLISASGKNPKFIVCNNDPEYSDEPTLNYWNGTNLIVLAGQKRN